MTESDFHQATSFLEDEKKIFLQKVLQEFSNIPSTELLPFLLGVSKAAQKKHMQFTPEEIELVFSALHDKISPKEQKQLDLVKQLITLSS